MWSKLLHPDLVQAIRGRWRGFKSACQNVQESMAQAKKQPGQLLCAAAQHPMKVWHVGALMLGLALVLRPRKPGAPQPLLGSNVVKLMPFDVPGHLEFIQVGDPQESYNLIGEDIQNRSTWSFFPWDWYRKGDELFAILVLNHIIDRLAHEKKVPSEVSVALGRITQASDTSGIIIDNSSYVEPARMSLRESRGYVGNTWSELVIAFMGAGRGTHTNAELIEKIRLLRALVATYDKPK